MTRPPRSNDLDPSHPLWKKAVRVRDVKSIGMTLYRVHPGVTVSRGGVLDSTPFVLVDCTRYDSKRVTEVFPATYRGSFWRDTSAIILFQGSKQEPMFRSPGWDHEKALLRLEFRYTITNPRYVILMLWQTEDAGCFWDGSDWRGAFLSKKFFSKKRAENALVTMVLQHPKFIGLVRIATV